jgi:hypothetical protein
MYPSLFLICFFISTALFLNSCGRFMLKDDGVENKSIEELSGVSSARTNLDGLKTEIFEITQTVGSDGFLAGFLLCLRTEYLFFCQFSLGAITT